MEPLNLEDPNQCWFRSPNEPANAYTAFCVYRDLDLGTRSIANAYRLYRNLPDSGTSRPSGTWNEWSIRFRWRERAEAYENHIDEAKWEADAKERTQRIETLAQQRLDRELKSFDHFERRIEHMDVLLDQYEVDAQLGLTGFLKTRKERINGRLVTKKIAEFIPVNGGDYASILSAQLKLESLAINGAPPKKTRTKKKRNH